MARFAEMRRAAAGRYGPNSQAVIFLLYEELLSMLTLLAAEQPSAVLSARVGELVPDIQRRFDSGGMTAPARKVQRTVSTNPTVIEFDRPTFEKYYRHPLERMGRHAVRMVDRLQMAAELRPGASYLYVVDDDGELWVWPQPHDLAEVMFTRVQERSREVTRVVHPMLVPERLRARAAGELVVVGSPERLLAVANLKSGHFRPTRECAVELRRAVERTIAPHDPADITVFTMPAPGRPDERA
ncbi:hypothetical protein ACIA8O_21720 [Kitasatospora sp. NPDC051853]|uniref:hypothetical protein n=1 Tax=Kitasatospora sp. NPDC051853 TaxID=3364058 RepID=UPI003791FA2E